MPFVLFEELEIVKVNDCVFALRELDSPKCISIPDFAIQKQKAYAKAHNDHRNKNGKIEFNQEVIRNSVIGYQ